MFEIVGTHLRARRAALAFACAATLALAACESDDARGTVTSAPDGGLLLEPPAPVLAARAVIVENLSLVVAVDGERVEAMQGDGGLWRATLDLAPGRSYTITLTWFELLDASEDPDGVLDGGLLPLAVFTEEEFFVTAGRQAELRVFNDQYDASVFDADDDGISNLRERRNDTRPVDDESPGVPSVSVPLTATFRLPAGLGDATPDDIDAFDVRATIGGRALPLSRDGTRWTGSLDVDQGERPVVAATFFSNAERNLALADAQRAVEVLGDAPSVTFEADDYEIRDSDDDGFSNFEELVGGTRPFDASDPPSDPCEISQFESGCRIDSDDDGLFDSQEGSERDRDGDGRPDYLESSRVDNDGDGRFADTDRDEGNACVPSTDNDACRSTLDDDGDGITNPNDNCRSVANRDQVDDDGDDIGNACDEMDGRDDDGDGVPNVEDNCPADSNGGQQDDDGDGDGNVCDDVDDRDPDGDGVLGALDNCPDDANRDQADRDDDGAGDACDDVDDSDSDGDGVPDAEDNCPDDANRAQADIDDDGIGDACDTVDDRDPDTDDDTVPDSEDNCPGRANRAQTDTDSDGTGDVCDPDDDGDRVADGVDNCPLVFNENQGDIDDDGIGDQCDLTDDRDSGDDGDEREDDDEDEDDDGRASGV